MTGDEQDFVFSTRRAAGRIEGITFFDVETWQVVAMRQRHCPTYYPPFHRDGDRLWQGEWRAGPLKQSEYEAMPPDRQVLVDVLGVTVTTREEPPRRTHCGRSPAAHPHYRSACRMPQRIAAHARSPIRGSFTTLEAHRPERHRHHLDRSHERLIQQADAIGPATGTVLKAQIHARKHPEYALRASQGIVRLAKDFSPEKLEAACRRALDLKTHSYTAIRALIQNPSALTPTPQAELRLSVPAHDNLRGPSYFR